MSELIDIERIRALRQSTTPWQMSVRDAPRRCDPAQYYRLAIVVSPGANSIRHMAPVVDDLGDDGELIRVLEQAMLQPHDDSLPPARPPAIVVDNPELAERIRLPMEACGVKVRVVRRLDAIYPVIEAIAQRDNLFSEGTLFGTEVMAQQLAAAAAELATCEPWRFVAGALPLRVRYSRADRKDKATRWLHISDSSKMEVACCSEMGALLAVMHASQSGSPSRVAPADSGWLMAFEPANEIAHRRRHAFARHGLACSHGLYPRFSALADSSRQQPIASQADALDVTRDLEALAALMCGRARQLLRGTFRRAAIELASGWRAEIELQPELSLAMALTDADGPKLLSEEEVLAPLIEVEHAVSVAMVKPPMLAQVAPMLSTGSDSLPALVIRCREQDAKPISAVLAVIDAVCFTDVKESDIHSEVVLAFRGELVLGVLTHCPTTHDRASLHDQLATPGHSEVVLLLAGRREAGQQKLRANEIVAARLVELREAPRAQ